MVMRLYGMNKFKNKYRISSHRKPNWDYSADALYFLTIVTQNRVCNLGVVVNKEMILSDFGKIVETEWFKSFDIRNELFLHDFVIMPNHLHAIVEINNVATRGNGLHNDHGYDDDYDHVVETHGRASLPSTPPTQPPPSIETDMVFLPDLLAIKPNPPVRLPKSISSFISGFKSAVNTKIDDYIDENRLSIEKYNKSNHFFQPNYHDHIIRNQFEYQNISNYIANNPAKWLEDRFYVTAI